MLPPVKAKVKEDGSLQVSDSNLNYYTGLKDGSVKLNVNDIPRKNIRKIVTKETQNTFKIKCVRFCSGKDT